MAKLVGTTYGEALFELAVDEGREEQFLEEVTALKELLKQNPEPDKEQNQMAWVQHMNSLKAQAEELVLTELIYS